MTKNSATPNKVKKLHKNLFYIIIFVIIINILAYFFYFQFDLTEDKKFTITPTTKELLKNVEKRVVISVYLHGEEMPAAFKSLSKSTENLLKNFRSLSNNKVTYEFIDPLGNDDALNTLNNYRMSGVPVTVDAGKKGTNQKMLFPWALVRTVDRQGNEKAFPVFLQETNTPQLSRLILNKSEMLLEYNIAKAIHQVLKEDKFSVAYLMGNGQPFGYDIIASFGALGSYFHLDTLNLQANNMIPAHFDAVIINRPLEEFSEIDKFKIDQYLMNGKSLFINIDAVTGSLDSLTNSGSFNSMAIDLNLSDLFFHYGFRVNANIIEDAIKSVGIPLAASAENAQPVFFPWVYFPILQAGSDHPIVKNLNGVLGRFVSSIDLNTNDENIRKTPLLVTSEYSRTLAVPNPIILESAMEEINPRLYTSKHLNAAVLLEGKFTSAFSSRQPMEVREFIQTKQLPLLNQSASEGKIIVVGDGQVMMNEFSEKDGPSDMGIYKYERSFTFDNKSFVLNSMEYLTDPNNLLGARTKNFEARLLDPKITEEEREKWQIINIGIPVLSFLFLGGIFFFIRKKKFS